jgi:hypothetical protein
VAYYLEIISQLNCSIKGCYEGRKEGKKEGRKEETGKIMVQGQPR